jgi:hypothetical protein
MLGAVVASALVGLLAVHTRRSFAWGDPMVALMLVSAGLMVVMCGDLLFDGRWLAAAFTAPWPRRSSSRRRSWGASRHRASARTPTRTTTRGGGGGGFPPRSPPPCRRPGPGLDWDEFDALRESWARRGSRSGV